MAKGSAMGLWRGKKGSNVFYKIANSSNGQQQGIRQRVFDVANPKTAAQAQQRIKMRAAQNFYNALAPVLDRARQGVKYGGLTRQDFMSAALKMQDGFPCIAKGDPAAVPGEYLVAKGSLNEFSFDRINNNYILFNSPVTVNFDLDGGSVLDAEAVAQLTANGSIHEGDQITVILCKLINGSFIYVTESCLVKVGETLCGSLSFQINDPIAVVSTGDNTLVAAAIIISRQSGTSYLRSNATMAIKLTALTDYFGDAARRAGIRSYMAAGARNANVDWPVEPIPEVGEVIYQPYTLSGLKGAAAPFNGKVIRVAQSVDTGVTVAKYGTAKNTLIVIGDNEPVCVDYETGLALVVNISDDACNLSLSAVTALSSLPTITI